MTAMEVELVPEAAVDARAIDEGLALVQNATAVVCNGLGRYAQALEAAEQAGRKLPDPAAAALVLPELIEAASRSGDTVRAAEALDRLARFARATETDWALGLEARSRALVSDGHPAEALYREAIRRLARTGLPMALARAHLLYGEWLRRVARRVDARVELTNAQRMFDELGLDAFAERARRELLATGATARTRNVETRDDLTPQEEQIARLAADGRTNPEIGLELFLSPRTVEWHLRKVYLKLGIRRRTDLRDVLPVLNTLTGESI
jgi:DNA-binding NarL/FixJ family response regulator